MPTKQIDQNKFWDVMLCSLVEHYVLEEWGASILWVSWKWMRTLSHEILVMIHQNTQQHVSEDSKKPSYSPVFDTDHSSAYLH
jgi:hypothetical protein